ncbi:gamma-interferon-inducible lysosomal thiol reductase-like [Arctopsyche grandis]|uniref:gamma-interferon-inducible lysosomal thiol reductase-like n=1 Tax=Arctopsyche grandis TaxID=121162 RepID=UPI00406D82DD
MLVNKFLTLTLFAAVGLLAANANVQKETKLKFSFYITSQCRDTINFVTRQLHPTYQELKDYLDVEFVPWGKSRRNNGSITCQFGPTDCVANKIQSCVLSILGNDQAKQVDYINCEMSNLSAVQQDYSCAISVGVGADIAKQCFDSTLGDQLQEQAEKKTGTITMVFVPTIVYNDVYSVQVQNAAFANFKQYACSLLKDESPVACG